MSSGFTDWTDLGIFPLQDTEEGVPIGMRMSIVAGRVAKRHDASGVGGTSVTEYAREGFNGLGTLGDVHPWFFWQTSSREKRDMGSWSMAWGVIATDLVSAYYGGGTGVQPLSSNGGTLVNDIRYQTAHPLWQQSLPWQPEGMLGILMPTTNEQEPESVFLSADRRLVAPNAAGPGEVGTTIVDMQPDTQMCMDGSVSPGQGGRHARLQGLVRVVALSGWSTMLSEGVDLNGIAINYGSSEQDGILGYGMVYGPAGTGGGGGSSTTSDVTTGDTRPSSSEETNAGSSPSSSGRGGTSQERPRGGSFASSSGDTLNDTAGGGGGDGQEKSVSGFGSFSAHKRPDHAIGFMSAAASGPISFGCGKHLLGIDKDGHWMTSAHISSGAYFQDSGDRDGPMMFEGEYPRQTLSWSLPTSVHLSWDKDQSHHFVGGERSGKWRWWTTVPYIEPTKSTTEPPGGDPRDPSRPSTPNSPNGPTTPGSGGPSQPPVPYGAPGTPGYQGPPGSPTTEPGGDGIIRFPPIPYVPNPPRGRPYSPVTPGAPGGPYGPIPYRPDPNLGPRKPRRPVTPGNLRTEPPIPYGSPGGGGYLSPGVTYAEGQGLSDTQSRGTAFPDVDHELTYIEGVTPVRQGPIGVVEKVGGSTQGADSGLYSILHPFNTGFAAITFRPQLWIKGVPNFEHNPTLGATAYKTEERTRPSVLTIRAWGAQNESGDWDYATTPALSRARGGIAKGGILIAPAEFEMEDYLGINSDADTDDPTVSTYVTFAPKVAAAFGKPTTAGYPSIDSKLVHQDTATGELLISNMQPGGVPVDIAKISYSADGGYVELEGAYAVKVPVGATVKRPSVPVAGMLRLNSTTSRLEVYHGTGWTSFQKGLQDIAPIILFGQSPSSYTTERIVTKVTPRAGTITSAMFNLTDGITADANRYWIFKLYNDAGVVATLSTATTTIVANTSISMGAFTNADFDGTDILAITVQSVNDGTQPQNLLGDYATFDIKMDVD